MADKQFDSTETFVELLRWRALHDGDRTAYTFLGDDDTVQATLTYGELDRQARAIAVDLRSRLNTGARALLLYPAGLEFIAAFFGCLYAGVIAVPAYPPRDNRNAVRLQAIMKDAGADAVLTTGAAFRSLERQIRNDAALQRLAWKITDAVSAETASDWKEPELSRDSTAFLQYTSGSTGRPKGVIVSHGNLMHNERVISEAFGYTRETVAVGWLPLFHDMGLIGNMLQPLYVGFPFTLMSAVSFLQRPVRWLQAVSRYRATVSGGPNFAYDLCVNRITPAQREGLDLSSWNIAFTGAEPVRARTVERFAEAFGPRGFRKEAFYPCYGMAEATLFITGAVETDTVKIREIDSAALEQNRAEPAQHKREGARRIVSCGRPRLDQQIAIADPESLQERPEGAIGEIWTAGPSVAQGYWNRPDETEKTFKARLAGSGRGPFLRTGDLGFMYEGDLYVTGREKDLIIIRGRNHYPEDIEATVERSHPGLRAGGGAAFGIEAGGEERVVIVQEIERSALRKLNREEAALAIRKAVTEGHELHVHAVQLLKPASIPKTSSGKIQRHACREAYLRRELDIVGEWREDEAGQALKKDGRKEGKSIEAVQEWLKRKIAERTAAKPEEISVRETFAGYGLDSLAAVTLTGELEEWLGRSVPPTLAYDYPTIEALSRHLCRNEKSSRREREKAPEKEAIAIIGMGCRFPGAENPEGFWKLLKAGEDAIREVPADRWDINKYYDRNLESPEKMNTRWGGFLGEVDKFDPFFFSLSPREAAAMDPQQRLLLEVAWEAFEDAGIGMERIAGSHTGVFIGLSSCDYYKCMLTTPTRAGTGIANSVAANRLSYFFDLHGPSLAVDTACSSSLVALHMACQSLLTGESDAAVAGGVNVILSPEITVAFSQAGMMASDGRCKSFDASADGYVRGEGCGMVILKRLSDALRDGDRVHALVRGSAVNQDGHSNGLTAPNGLAQQAVIRRALKNAGVSPGLVDYIETHGSGTPLGDVIEVQSLSAVLGERDADRRCGIGSVKTNIGHLEAAAGIAGLIKTVLLLQHGEIPPHPHFNRINPRIDLAQTPFEIPTSEKKSDRAPEFAGVSSFGFGGTNAHVILEKFRPGDGSSPADDASSGRERPLHILTLSAKSAKALDDLAGLHQRYFSGNSRGKLPDICFTANAGRTHFDHRLAVIACSREDLCGQLTAPAGNAPNVFRSRAKGARRPKIVYFFSGESDGCEAGQGLFETLPVLKKNIEQCDEILRPRLQRPLIEVLCPGSVQPSAPHAPGIHGPALLALQYALAQLWRSWGIEPDAVFGCGAGGIAAACVSGELRLEDGLRLAGEPGSENAYSASFPDGIASAVDPDAGRRIILAMGPAGGIPQAEPGLRLSSLERGQDGWECLLRSLAALYAAGANVDWKGFDLGFSRKLVTLPTYPFQRKRCWLEPFEIKSYQKEDYAKCL